MQANSHCWICEGWSEFQFDFIPEEWIDLKTVPVKLHLSCDNYVGEIMDIDKEKTAKVNDAYRKELAL